MKCILKGHLWMNSWIEVTLFEIQSTTKPSKNILILLKWSKILKSRHKAESENVIVFNTMITQYYYWTHYRPDSTVFTAKAFLNDFSWQFLYIVNKVMKFCSTRVKFIYVLSIDEVLILCHKDTDQIIFLTMMVKDGHLIQGNHFEWTTIALFGGLWLELLSQLIFLSRL